MGTHKRLIPVFIVASLLGMLLTGCATTVGSKVIVSADNLSRYDNLSSSEAIDALEKRVNEARDANMPFLAPNYFREASEIMAELPKLSAKKSTSDLIIEIAKADAMLDKGQSVMVIVQSLLASELEQVRLLDKHNGPRVFPNEYEKYVGHLSDLIEKVELDETETIESDRLKLLKNLSELVVKTVQYNTLHESDVINEDTRGKDGEKLAPATLGDALRVYQEAMNRIALAPHDEAVVKRAGDDAMFAALHARHVSERVLSLQIQFKESVEQIVLGEEKLLLDVANALGHKDPRDLPLEKQAETLARLAREIAQKQTDAKPAAEAGEPATPAVNPPPSVQVNELPVNELPRSEETPPAETQ